ncbi:MAG: twitching motility protein PilT [Eubacteriales bacterium]
MVQLMVGKKGKGKTKYLLDKVNNEVKDVAGNITYLDKSTKHMFELNNKVRLIDVSDYNIEDSKEFIGFISGIISQDNDLQKMYFDSFLKIAQIENEGMVAIVSRLEKISEKFDVDFILSVSLDECEMDECLKKNIILSL